MESLRDLEEQVAAAEDTMTPSLHGRLGVVRAVGVLLRVSLMFTLPLGLVVGAAYGTQLGAIPLFVGTALGIAAGFVPEFMRRRLLVLGYRHVLGRADLQGLQAIGGVTSAALPSFTPKKQSPGKPPPPPAFVEPVRPPPRLGDLDAEDFED